MEALKRTSDQFVDLYHSMSPSQRGTLIVVPLLIAAAFAFLMFSDRSSSSYVAASWGKVFRIEELIHAEQALNEAGLRDYRREGQLLMVPRKEVDRYNAALLASGSLPTNWAEEREKQLESSGMFTSLDGRQERRDIALAASLSQIIRAVPDVDDAQVIWTAPTRRRRFGIKPRVTATIFVKPRGGKELPMRQIQAFRLAVANAIPDLGFDDVTVFNQSTAVSYPTGDESDSFDNRVVTQIRRFEQLYRDNILQALSYINEVIVTVNVDLEKVKSSVERSQKVDPKGTVALQSSEQNRTSSSSQQASRAEPGNVSNQPRSLQTAGGGERSQSLTETQLAEFNAASFTISEKEFLTAMPEAVQVNVSIPDDYYERIALKQGHPLGESDEEKQAFQQAVDAIRADVEDKVRATVLKHIPADSPEEAINVSSHLPMDRELPEIGLSMTETVGNAVSQWGGAVGLGLFALWILWMLNKSLTKVPADDSGSGQPAFPKLPPDDDDDEEQTQPKELTKRDQLQSIVRDNPEMAAAVISKWIQAAK